jgi:hypothetical protein
MSETSKIPQKYADSIEFRKALLGAQENLIEEVQAMKAGLDINALIGILLPFLIGLIQKKPPVQPAPQPQPTPEPEPAPTPVPVPPDEDEDTPLAPAPLPGGAPPEHRINGGRATVTGIQEGVGGKWDGDDIVAGSVRQWVELDEARVNAICDGSANAPNVCRIMTGCTPTAEDGYEFKPEDPTWEDDPQPGSVEDPGAEPMRLVWDDDTDQIYLTHEYHDYGNRNWIRCSVTPGTGQDIRAPHYVGPRYPDTRRFAKIPLTRKGKKIDVIHVGRGA